MSKMDMISEAQRERAETAEVAVKHEVMTGLTDGEVLENRKRHGENRLPVSKDTSAWMILLSQFKSPLIYIILVAALISLVAGEYGDFWIITAVIIIDVVLGFLQEYKAHKTYTALKNLLKPTTTVIRNSERREVEVWELVPHDLVLLNFGENVPGDGMLIESTKVTVDEAILTGESEPVSKSNEEGRSKVFMGTTVLTGRGLMLVEQTGSKTELGQIATSLQEHVEAETPLQIRLKAFSKTLTWIVVGFTLAILLAGLVHGTRVPGHAAHFHYSSHRRRAGRFDHRRNGHSGAGNAQNIKAQRPGQETARGGDAGLSNGYLYRQDRHPDRGTDAHHPYGFARPRAFLPNHGVMQRPRGAGRCGSVGVCKKGNGQGPSGTR